MRIRQRIFQVFALVSLACVFSSSGNVARATTKSILPLGQEQSGQIKAQALIEEMTPEEKVGQLFLVTFDGTDVSPDLPIYELITQYHIGGVVLKRENGNIPNQEEVAESTWNLIKELQSLEHTTTYGEEGSPEASSAPAYIPLFVGLSQEGDNSSHTQLLDGISPIPSQMAIGATWNTELSQQVGNSLGRELSVLGVNLLLGPSLDVLETPHPGEPSDLGVRTFGGDPYWVGRMGQAYAKGIHEGSKKRVLVVGKYFPGLGSADRLPEKEIATVRKSLEQLKQIELAPFFAVTGEAPSAETTVDGLLASHIRYQGLQGNIRSTTRPISLDPQALRLLMELDPLSGWRQNGGLMISDSLGSQALRYFYDPSGNTFNARQVALDAFFAGNDVLYLGDFLDSNLPDTYTTVHNTLTFFAQKYREDQTFAELVDEAVLRILSKKYTVYDSFDLSQVLTSQASLSSLEVNNQIASEVARQAVTLISPSLSELNGTIPNPPSRFDSVIIIADSFKDEASGRELGITSTSLRESVLRLYGPQAGQQIPAGNLISYTYEDIIRFLDSPADYETIETNFSRANWIIAASLNTTRDRPSSLAFQRLLSERQDLIRDTKLVVFAFNAPYYLDATNISKINAFYGLYSKLPSFVELAARILFKEVSTPPGDLPVSVPGIGYDLISATSPDPEQTFSIYMGEAPPNEEVTDQPEETPSFPVYNVGDVVNLQTGVILDHNGNPVPDGTPVQFVTSIQGEETYLPLVETNQGQAQTSLLIEIGADVQVYAISSPAESEILQIKVAVQEEETVDATPQPTVTPTNTPTLSPTPQVEKVLTVTEISKVEHAWLNWQVWGMSFLMTTALSIIAYLLGAILGQVRWGLRWGLSAFMGGFTIYNYLALEFPGSVWVTSGSSPLWSVAITVVIGAILGWTFAFFAGKLRQAQATSPK
ncbi:MAG: Beta-hexosaminidase [Chloroflexi bacterium]|nr:Beta-hexosaminidase [Chloroflexota bacterium]